MVKSPMEKLLGPNLLTSVNKTESTNSVMKGKDLVLFYFSASWCPPCQRFTPLLTNFYNDHCKKNNIEIVYISSDHDQPSFKEYYGKMPWASIPMMNTVKIKQDLAGTLNIQGLPTLVVMDVKSGKFVTDNARNEVDRAGDSAKCLDLIKKWKETEAVPIEEANFSSSGQGGILWKIFMFFMSNPMYIIGSMFFVKKFLRKLQELGDDEPEL